MTLAWDEYTDTAATDLRIYHSTDQTNWTVLVDSIPTSMVASEIPDNANNQERVYYMMRGANTTATPEEESGNSNIVSYFWTTSGGGHTGPAGVGGISLIDCEPYDSKPDDGSPEWETCSNRYRP